MGMHRFFTAGPVADSGVLPLAASDLHHLRDVLRLRPGDEVELADGTAVWRVRLDSIGADVSGTRLAQTTGSPTIPRVTLAQALAKGEKMDLVVRQATELGVSRIVPFEAERSVVRLDPAKARARAERWRRIAESAAKQAHLDAVPEVSDPVGSGALSEALAGATVLVCWEDAGDAPGILSAIERAGAVEEAEVAVVVGPEGGLTPAEVAALCDAGALIVTLGPTVLRAETAGVVAAALVLAARGGLGTGCG